MYFFPVHFSRINEFFLHRVVQKIVDLSSQYIHIYKKKTKKERKRIFVWKLRIDYETFMLLKEWKQKRKEEKIKEYENIVKDENRKMVFSCNVYKLNGAIGKPFVILSRQKSFVECKKFEMRKAHFYYSCFLILFKCKNSFHFPSHCRVQKFYLHFHRFHPFSLINKGTKRITREWEGDRRTWTKNIFKGKIARFIHTTI